MIWISMIRIITCRFAVIGIAIAMTSCKKEEAQTPPSANEVQPFLLSGPWMSDQEYADLAAKAKEGDADAAYQLYQGFTYGKRNCGLAYFWVNEAKRLNPQIVDDKEIELARNAIFREAADLSEEAKKRYRSLKGLKPGEVLPPE